MKNKNTTYIVAGISAVILIVVIVLVLRARNKKKTEQANAGSESSDADLSASNPAATTIIYNNVVANDAEEKSFFSTLPELKGYPIKFGDVNKGVYLLQAALNKIHGSGLSLDGVFGSATQSAIKANYNVSQVDAALAAKIYNAYK